MPHKAEYQILQDLYDKLVKGGLEDIIGGGIYLKKRPPNSTKEDCVISLLAGVDGQFQSGSITCNVYVQNVEVAGWNGYLAEDHIRTAAISDVLNRIVHDCSIMSCGEYDFRPATIISVFELEEQDAHQYFVNVELSFNRLGNN